MFDTAYLHIGTAKTGSTSIQNFLAWNRVELRKRGFFFPEVFELANQVGLAAYAADIEGLQHLGVTRGIVDTDTHAGYRADIRRRFASEVQTYGREGGVLLLSNEHLHSRVTSEEGVRRLHELLAPYCREIKVVVYIRRQDILAVSLASTYHKVGRTSPWQLPDIAKPQIRLYYDFERLLDRYAAHFGTENCIVRIFEPARLKAGDVTEDFLAIAGIPEWPEMRRPTRANESLSNLGMSALAELHKHLEDRKTSDVSASWGELMGAVTRACVGKPSLITKQQAIDFYEVFRAGNSAVRHRFFPDLDRDTLFDEDFGRYPEALPQENRTFEEGIEIAAKLWLDRMQVIMKLRDRLDKLPRPKKRSI